MTTPNLDALAKLAPFYAIQGKVWTRSEGLPIAASDIAAALNEWAELRKLIPTRLAKLAQFLSLDHVTMVASLTELAELRAYRERTEAALFDLCDNAEDESFEGLKRRLTKFNRGLWREPGQGAS